MQKWLGDIIDFALALIPRTASRLTGGIIVGAVGVFFALGGHLNEWVVWALVSVAFFAASFTAWKDEREIIRKLKISHQAELDQKNALLLTYDTVKQKQDELGRVHAALVQRLDKGRKLLNTYSAVAYNYTHDQIDSVNAWQEDVEKYLGGHLGDYAQLEFQKPTGNGGSMLVDDYYTCRLKSSKLSEQLTILESIIKNPKLFMPPS